MSGLGPGGQTIPCGSLGILLKERDVLGRGRRQVLQWGGEAFLLPLGPKEWTVGCGGSWRQSCSPPYGACWELGKHSEVRFFDDEL